MNYKNIVSKNISKYLKYQCKSQVDLANHVKVSKAAVSNWIQGKSSPDINNIKSICDFLDISINDIFGVYDEKHLSVEEKIVIKKYRETDFRSAINKLLELEK